MKREEKLGQLDLAIRNFYNQPAVSDSLVESILYSVQAGGKRIRPLLLLELVEAFGVSLAQAFAQAAHVPDTAIAVALAVAAGAAHVAVTCQTQIADMIEIGRASCRERV